MRPRRATSGPGFGLVAMVATVGSLVGCAYGGSDASARKTSLELQIQRQLPQQARQTLGTVVIVNSVSCTALTDTTFNCLASVRGSNLRGQLVNQNVPIDGSCDSESCIWNVKAP